MFEGTLLSLPSDKKKQHHLKAQQNGFWTEQEINDFPLTQTIGAKADEEEVWCGRKLQHQ